jgi:hypothetical protein
MSSNNKPFSKPFEGFKFCEKFESDIEKYKLLVLILVAASVGVLAMPHDTPVATIASKYIFPAVVAGFCLGIAFMAAIGLWQRSKKDNISTNKESA